MTSPRTLAIIGAGPSALYTLQHGLRGIAALRSRFDRILVFERQAQAGPGMPYSREQNSPLNLSNISSEELPELPETFAAWLEKQSPERLAELRVPSPVREDEIYPRLALGAYFHAQFLALARLLTEAGVAVEIHTGSEVADIGPRPDGDGFFVRAPELAECHCAAVVIATGHAWPADRDKWNHASPWPVHKLVPPPGEFHDFAIGLLGASLSAVDVINVLAHHHGAFVPDGKCLAFEPHPQCPHFRMTMHSIDGALSHLQFEQDYPIRTLYRHCTEQDILAQRDDAGRLSLHRFFDAICRPVLIAAFKKDDMAQEAAALADPGFGFSDFADMMAEEHATARPFEQMKAEYREASQAIRKDEPTHWKEVLDDLMYTLNFHAGTLSAEDHLELHSKILPFVMNVMAALPLESAKILIALHDSGRLEIVHGAAEVDEDSADSAIKVSVKGEDGSTKNYRYRMFVNCTGQATADMDAFPFPSMAQAGLIRPARAPFADSAAAKEEAKVSSTANGEKVLELGGIEITAGYQVVDRNGSPVEGLYDMAMPHVAGLRPYCYGLQVCSEAARIVLGDLLKTGQPIEV